MRIISTIIFLLLAIPVNAHDTEDMIIMQMANDALTIRVSELLAENKKLKEFAKNALIVQSQGKDVRLGCNPQDLRETLVTGSGRPSDADKWLKKNHRQCTKDQLEYIHQEIRKWSSYGMADTKRLISYYIDNM